MEQTPILGLMVELRRLARGQRVQLQPEAAGLQGLRLHRLRGELELGRIKTETMYEKGIRNSRK